MARSRYLYWAIAGLAYFMFVMTSWAIERSPAGGGYLRFPGDTSYALIKPRPLLEKRCNGLVTIEAWVYLEEIPGPGEAVMLFQKPEVFHGLITGRTQKPGLGPQISLESAHKSDRGWGHGSSLRSIQPETWLYFFVQRDVTWELSRDPLYLGIKKSDRHPGREGKLLPWDYLALAGAIDELRLSDTNRHPKGYTHFIGHQSDRHQIPREPFVADEHTVGLWHFDRQDEHPRDVVNGLVIQPRGGAYSLLNQLYSVEPVHMSTILWARLKAQ